MFDLFKQDIKVGDSVKLYLTTGKEPKGIVLSIGDNFVLLQTDDKTQNRFLEKLIGGWDVISIQNADNKIIEQIADKENRQHKTNQNFILEIAKLFKDSLNKNLLSKFIESNANIIEVGSTICTASNSINPKILIFKDRIVDLRLLSDLNSFQEGTIVPIIISSYEKDSELITTAAAYPNTLEVFLDNFIEQLGKSDFSQARIILNLIRKEIKINKLFSRIIKELKKEQGSKNTNESNKVQISEIKKVEGKRTFKSVEKEINDLIRQSKFDFALSQIDNELTNNLIEEKYKSSLLLKKAQIFSALNNPEASEKAYEELVIFNEKINSSPNNLSHLYTELGRLQALKTEKRSEAVQSVKKALKYNPNNNFASNLLKQLEGNILKSKKEIKNKDINYDDHLLIEANDEKATISNMIDLDLKEHKYSHPEIIKNGGIPTTFIAELILKETRDAGGVKVTENYPLYLEAAKAFSELNIGSYELKDYLEAVAYYSMLKGNSVYNQFKHNVINNQIDLQNLFRLNESACDYYIETLNIISNIDSKSLFVVLTNYLQLKVAKYYLESTDNYFYSVIFETKFTSLFYACIWSKEEQVKKIAFKAIVDIGSNSIAMWNKLNDIFLNSNIKIKSILEEKENKILINNVLNTNINYELNPVSFLKNAFNILKQEIDEYRDKTSNFFRIEFTPTNFRTLFNEWSSLSKFNHLLQKTDKETFLIIDNIILIIQPYLNRPDKERGNILYSVIKKIEIQLEFINQNTTFYGRTFFYRLLKKWRTEVDYLFEEKIAQSYPLLAIQIDPPYYVETNGEISAPLIIKNEGEATAEGYTLNIICESTVFDDKHEILYETAEEVPSGGKKEMTFIIPRGILDESNAVEIKVEIEAIYQKKKLPPKIYEFTVEKEPPSFLKIEDIPWRTGNSTPEALFFGREKLITNLFNHYRSSNKDKPFILYGLTRTGKSSILEYLRKKIENSEIIINGSKAKIISFEWELQEVSNNINARDFYNDVLSDRIFNKVKNTLQKDSKWDGTLSIDEKGKFTDFKKILEFLKSKGYYPIIFVDEFSYIKDLMDRGTIGKGFLAALREFSLNGLASFVFAGTYDIKKLITDERYGITGQLVHIIEHQVDKIEPKDAEALISIIDEKLSFTPEAIDHIKKLSGNIPYFIQIICKNCGDYAVENKRRFIGYPELEKVVQTLTGEYIFENSILSRLPTGIFQNNQYSTTDPKEVEVLISSICHLNKGNLNPRGIGSHEIEKYWSEKGLISFKSKLAVSFQSLIDRKILLDSLDEGIPVYKFSVDLFRRWWYVSHQDINLEISTLKEE